MALPSNIVCHLFYAAVSRTNFFPFDDSSISSCPPHTRQTPTRNHFLPHALWNITSPSPSPKQPGNLPNSQRENFRRMLFDFNHHICHYNLHDMLHLNHNYPFIHFVRQCHWWERRRRRTRGVGVVALKCHGTRKTFIQFSNR